MYVQMTKHLSSGSTYNKRKGGHTYMSSLDFYRTTLGGGWGGLWSGWVDVESTKHFMHDHDRSVTVTMWLLL